MYMKNTKKNKKKINKRSNIALLWILDFDLKSTKYTKKNTHTNKKQFIGSMKKTISSKREKKNISCKMQSK